MSPDATFPMQDGPPITWERAREIYRLYSCLYGTQQSLETIAKRGGFGYAEVPILEAKHREQVTRRGICYCNH